MLELGAWSKEAHCGIVRKADKVAGEIILVGKEFANAHNLIGGELESSYTLYPTTAEAMEALAERPISNALVLLKGSRGIALERLIEKL